MPADPFKNLIVRHKKGTQIYAEGDLGSEMYVIQSGAVRVFRELAGVKQELAIMERGDFFGEIAVLEGLPRSAAAEAIEDVELIEINSTTFDRMIRGNIEIAVRMLRKLSNRLQEANRKLEILSRATSRGQAAAKIGVVDIDRPAEAPPAPEAAPSVGVASAPQPVSEIEVPEGAMALLVQADGSRHFPITTDTSIIGRYDPVTGTRPEIDLTQIDINRSVSRRHARIVLIDGVFQLSEEVGALNGTFVNGQRLTSGTPANIVSGDKLGLGMVSLIFKAAQPSRKSASAGRS